MKNLRRIMAIVLCCMLMLALAACGGKETPEPEDTASPEPSAQASEAPPSEEVSAQPEEPEFESYSIGFSNLGTGIWILDLYQRTVENYLAPNGLEVMSLSANFSADQMVTDVQSMCSGGVRGAVILPAIPTMIPSASKIFEENKVYWAGYSQLIINESLDIVEANPYYCGVVGQNAVATGRQVATIALEDGKSKAIIVAGAIGNTTHDGAIAGFTEVFEAGGGEILGVCHSENESTQQAEDLMAAYGSEIDCAYGINMVFVESAITAVENYGYELGKDIMIYGSEIDAVGAEHVKNGIMKGMSQNAIDGAFNVSLVVNAIDGKLITDPEGNAVWLDTLRLFQVTEDNIDDYMEFWVEGFPLPQEGFDQLLYRHNPDVDYDFFVDTVAGYNYEYVMGLRG